MFVRLVGWVGSVPCSTLGSVVSMSLWSVWVVGEGVLREVSIAFDDGSVLKHTRLL